MQSGLFGNTLLDALLADRPAAADRVLSEARTIDLVAGQVLQQAGRPIEFVCFPLSGILAMAWTLDEGGCVSVLGVGRTGAIHATLDIDLDRATCGIVAPMQGRAILIPAPAWQEFATGDAQARLHLDRYLGQLLTRSHRALACLMKHDVESRLCGWLLDLDDWERGRPISITHEGLARLLGVRRTTVTLMARTLQDAGIIWYRRGLIEVVDRHALRLASCECRRPAGGTGHDACASLGAGHAGEQVPEPSP